MDPLLDDAPCGFLSVLDDGHIAAVNATFATMLGAAREALEGRHVDAILTTPSRIFYQTHVFPTLKLQGRVHEVYLTLGGAEGEELPVMVNIVRRPRAEQFVSDWIVMLMRQRNEYENEILKARRAAEDATRAKDEFLSVVSHELRSPLSAISGWTHIMSAGRLDAAATARAIESIERNVKHQAKLIDDILDFGRMATGRLKIDVHPLDLEPVIAASVEGVMPAARAKSIRVETTVDERPAVVMGDSLRLQQVLWNILNNAVKFTDAGGYVHLRLARDDPAFEIVIRDNGRGIAPEFLPRVFESFRQEEEGQGRREGGLGLGMSIASKLVELHGGTIAAESAGRGQGATFTVRLPAFREAA
jgi:signal transduction histidine kinase